VKRSGTWQRRRDGRSIRKKEEFKRKSETKWNLAKEEGWKKYKEASNKEANKIVDAVQDKTKTIDEVMNKFNKVHDNIKYKAFGKVTLKEKVVKSDTSVDGSEEDKAEAIHKEQEEVMNKEMEEIKSNGKGKVGRIWQVRKKIVGDKRAPI